MRFFENPSIDFMGLRRKAYLLSGLLIVVSLASIFFKGINWGVDFSGGTLLQVHVEGVDIGKVRSVVLGMGLRSATVQNFGEPNEFLIRYKENVDAGQVVKGLKDKLGKDVRLDRTEKVGPTIGRELKEQSIIIVIVALLLMLLYIWIRFDLYFGLGAVLALFHDSIITLGMYSLAGLEFTTTTVAALLTIIGYSINDTIVVSDRVREYLASFEGMKLVPSRLYEIFNKAINSTLSRTIITSFTTLIVVLALMIFGGPVLFGFAFTLFVGIVVGTYSSIFVVSALVYELKTRKARQAHGNK